MHSEHELTSHQRTFMNLPLHVFHRSTNIHELVVEKFRKKNGKEPLTIAVNNTIKKYHEQMLKIDGWDDMVLNRLEYTSNSKDKMNDARIWSLSKREQKRIFNAASDHQKKFLCLPLNVLMEQTNICSLVRKTAHQQGYMLKDYVEYVHGILPKIGKWLPELQDLKFLDDTELDQNDVELSLIRSSDTSPTTRVLRKRKASGETSQSKDAAIPPKRVRTRSETFGTNNNENNNVASKKSDSALNSGNFARKSSKTSMIQKKRSFRMTHAPTDIQRQVEHFSFEDFVSKTNINEIILEEYRERVGNKNANILESEQDSRQKHYFQMRLKKGKWQESGLKNLKIIGTSNDSKNGTPASDYEMTDIFPSDDSTKSENSVSRQSCSDDLTDFQKEVKEMDFETFIRTTNVKDLVNTYVQTKVESKESNGNEFNDGLQYFDRLRKLSDEWNKDPLKHLFFITCQCKRYRQFDDTSSQTDSIQTRDYASQCQSVDLNSNDVDMLDNSQHNSSAIRTKMAKLTTHEICDSEIIYILETSEANEENNSNAQDILMAEPHENAFQSVHNSPKSTEKLTECDILQLTDKSVQEVSSNENENHVLEPNIQAKMAYNTLHDDGLINVLEQSDDSQSKSPQSNSSTAEVEQVQPEIDERCELVEPAPHLPSPTSEETVQTQNDESTNVQCNNSMTEFKPQQNSTELHLSMEDDSGTTSHAVRLDHSYHVREEADVHATLQTEENALFERKRLTVDGNGKENELASSQRPAQIQRHGDPTDNQSDVLRALSNAMRFTYFLEQLRYSNEMKK